MGVATKGRRKITRFDRRFFWDVFFDEYVPGEVLRIVSEDKKFIISYEVGQANKQNNNPFLVVMGKEFVGLSNRYSGYRRVLTPNWEDEYITPGLVRKIIDWCYSPKNEVVLVNWHGELLTKP